MVLRKILKTVFYSSFVLGFVWVSAQLFWESRTNSFLASVSGVFEDDSQGLKMDSLRVIYPDQLMSLEPTLNDPVTRQRLNNIYEPLVKLDRDLKVQPGLAVSWGMLGNQVWQFRLRPDVVFHDGTGLDSLDVKVSLDRALNYDGSELAATYSSIESINIVDESVFVIRTKAPDPLLLQRLSMLLIFPSEKAETNQLSAIGTGSYSLNSWKSGNELILERFDDYWGDKSQFEEVILLERPNKNERVNMFLKGEADFLAFVPYDAVEEVEKRGFSLESIPSLEVQFLLFNFKSPIFQTLENRQAFSLAIDQNALVEEVGGYARPVSQFVANGVLGYNPKIKAHEFYIDSEKEALLSGQILQFHIPIGLDVLGEHVRTQLEKLGASVIVSYMEWDDLLKSIEEADAELYFLGFKSEIGDATDFFDVVVRSGADFNIGSYSNEEVDKMIDSATNSLDPNIRLSSLQKAMKEIVENDVIGVPLFEYETLFAMIPEISFEPRIDGFLYFDDLIIK